MVCDAYIVQQPLITQIYINGLFQTNNNTYSVLTTHRFILIPINIFSYSVHTIDCQEGKYWYVHSCNTILSIFVQYNTHISSVRISCWTGEWLYSRVWECFTGYEEGCLFTQACILCKHHCSVVYGFILWFIVQCYCMHEHCITVF